MIYKFKSKAAGDVIMLGPNGDELLRLLGREPAAKGIIEPAAMPAALVALQEAASADDAARAAASASDTDISDTIRPAGITVRQRVWPMVEMLRRAQAASEPVVWGV
jgi:Domain of unknown function (DUF1840)